MSFSSDIKKELCRVDGLSLCDRDVLLYAMLRSFRQCTADEISFASENENIVKLFRGLLEQRFPEIKTTVTEGFNTIRITVTDKSGRVEMVNRYNLNETTINTAFAGENDDSARIFLRGVYLVCGSTTDPNKEYHLELLPPESVSGSLFDFICEHGINIKKTIRKNQVVLYIKESEDIEDFLTYIGAVAGSLQIMDVKIRKDFINKANRAANCETANIDRIVKSAQRQVNDIQLIVNNGAFNSLPKELKQLAEARLENQEASLKELGEMLTPPISRSGVNHRMEKIAKIAEKFKHA